MSVPQKFRSAFNGFNREDVVSYLEYLNSKHTAQVNQLTSEAEFLRSKLDAVHITDDQSDTIAALEQERDELRRQLDELQVRYDALAQARENEHAVPTAAAAFSSFGPAEELEVYRRAERTERMARDRADLIYRQANGVLKEAAVRISDASETIVPAAEQAMAQLTQLLEMIHSGKQSLQDAVVILNTLRSENN
jgi:predicted HAD superfamily phosphohydrolase